MPKYYEVNWSQAECFGTYTNLFYDIEEERNHLAYGYINAVRSICGRCPIWFMCLSYAFEYENYGVWGGLTSLERRSIIEPKKYPIQKTRALKDLSSYGIDLAKIMEAYEHTNNVGSVAHQITNNRENGFISHSRPRE